MKISNIGRKYNGACYPLHTIQSPTYMPFFNLLKYGNSFSQHLKYVFYLLLIHRVQRGANSLKKAGFLTPLDWIFYPSVGSGSKVVKDRLSQFACTVTTMHIMCTQRALHVHENLCMVLIPLCKNDLNLSISHTDHYALKQALPQRLNFQHNSTAIVQRLIQNLPQPYLKFQVSLIGLSQSDIQILYGLQIDNVIQQCVASKTGIFQTSSWSMVSILDSLHYFSFQFIKNGSDAM